MILAIGLWSLVRALVAGAAAVALENLALRYQLAQLWPGWRASLVIVQPATVLAWHRKGFQLYWRWKSRPNPVGRPGSTPRFDS